MKRNTWVAAIVGVAVLVGIGMRLRANGSPEPDAPWNSAAEENWR